MVQGKRVHKGRIEKTSRRRFPLVDGVNLRAVDEPHEYVDTRRVQGPSPPPPVNEYNRAGSVRGAFPVPAWVTRGDKRQRQFEGSAIAMTPGRVVHASPRRMELLVDEVTASNAGLASTVSLLRVRARDVAHRRNQLLNVIRNERGEPYIWMTPEGDGGERERSNILRRYIDQVVIDVTEIERDIHRDREAMRRLRLADRGGGRLIRILRERRQAVVEELAQRDGEGTLSQRVPSTCRMVQRRLALTSAPHPVAPSSPSVPVLADNVRHNPYVLPRNFEHASPTSSRHVDDVNRRLYPLQYAMDNRRILNDMEAEERGLRRPTANDRRIASRTRAFNDGNWDAVAEHDRDRDWRSAVARNARQRKKQRKRELANYSCRMGYGRRFVPDPRSDDDDGAPIC